MREKTRFLCLSCLFLVFLIVGCTNKEEVSVSISEDVNNDLKNEIVKLAQIIEKQKASIEEHEEKLTRITELDTLRDTISGLEESTTYLLDRVYLLENVIQHTTSYKTAMLNSTEIKGDTLNLNITYTNKINDEDAPNGFRLVKTEEGTSVLSIAKDVPVFLLETPGKSFQATWEQIVEYRGFLQLFEKSGEVVFISEVYLP